MGNRQSLLSNRNVAPNMPSKVYLGLVFGDAPVEVKA